MPLWHPRRLPLLSDPHAWDSEFTADKAAPLSVACKQLASLTPYWGTLFTLLPYCTEGTAV